MKRILLLIALAFAFAGCGPTRTESTVEQVPQVIAGNEMAAMSRLRSVVSAETAYQFEGQGEYATLDTLIAKGVMADPSQGKLSGYRYEVKVKPGGFEATAVPERYGITGRRSFFVDESRILRGADKKGFIASASDPVVQ